jgi:serine phosphatase RsbU (regulator of sigma subunit)
LTDGVPEARNAAGHLLGFECLAELSLQSPQAIAQAAIAYGQDDDITIVSVTMLPAAHSLATAAIYASAQAPA